MISIFIVDDEKEIRELLHQGSIWVENHEGYINFKLRLPIIRKE